MRNACAMSCVLRSAARSASASSTAFVGEQVDQLGMFRGGTIPDQVIASLAALRAVRAARHGIAQHLLAGGQAEAELLEQIGMGARRQSALLDQSAPRDVAGVLRNNR